MTSLSFKLSNSYHPVSACPLSPAPALDHKMEGYQEHQGLTFLTPSFSCSWLSSFCLACTAVAISSQVRSAPPSHAHPFLVLPCLSFLRPSHPISLLSPHHKQAEK